jgi:hypothetical protein
MTKERQKEREELFDRARRLTAQQGVKPISNVEELRADFWPPDESADEFLSWLHSVRQDEPSGSRPE